MILNTSPNKWHGNWIITIQRFHPGFVETALVDHILKSVGPGFRQVMGDYERPR